LLLGCAQGEAAPLAVFGLLQHESKLSVLNFSLRKAAAFEAPLPNKAPLLFVTGLRCIFTLWSCRSMQGWEG
jgi:pre-rRNA-processing protein TSR1